MGVAVTAFAIYACSEGPATNYGNPNSLDRRTIPGEGGVEELVCSADAGSDAGRADGGCAVSFARDIYPAFLEEGAWKCSAKDCHGGKSAPDLAGKNAAEVLQKMRGVIVANRPYLPAGSDGGAIDPNKFSLLCNLHGDCGSKMPRPPGKDLETADLCRVNAWLACGAPEN